MSSDSYQIILWRVESPDAIKTENCRGGGCCSLQLHEHNQNLFAIAFDSKFFRSLSLNTTPYESNSELKSFIHREPPYSRRHEAWTMRCRTLCNIAFVVQFKTNLTLLRVYQCRAFTMYRKSYTHSVHTHTHNIRRNSWWLWAYWSYRVCIRILHLRSV